MSELIDTSTAEGQKEWKQLCRGAFENLPTDTTVTFGDVDAILTEVLPEYERMTAQRREARRGSTVGANNPQEPGTTRNRVD